jgi:carboxypeptidase PM20D1
MRITTLRLSSGAALALLVGLTLARMGRNESAHAFLPLAPVFEVADGAAARLAGAVRIRTISSEDPGTLDAGAFRELHAYLESAFPRVHARLRRETVAAHSLLYTWPGSDPSLKPMLLLGHLDVVPVESGSESAWRHGPFSGDIAEGFIWGRGAIDNKSTVVGTLEAVETLLGEGFQPARTVYLAFGHDEETGGAAGAAEIAALLGRRGIRLEMVLDEGGVIGDGLLPGVSGPVALVGIAEKGFVSVELSVRAPGGHSSLPPRQTAAGIVSAAVARLEASPMPARLTGPTEQLFDTIGPRMPFVPRTLFANLWLARTLVLAKLEASPTTNAMVRTTTAVTLLQAGTKDNVLPSHARAVVNFRLLPGDSVAGVLAHVRSVVDDARVEVRTGGRFTAEPSAVSSTESGAFHALERSIRGVTPDAVVAPYLVVVVTDARHYAGLTDNVFRFLPIRVGPRDLERMHGIDERIGIEVYEDAIRTYRELIVEVASGARA